MSVSRHAFQKIFTVSAMIIVLTLSCTQKNPLDSTVSILGNQPTLVNMKADPSEVSAGGGIASIQVTLLDPKDKPLPGAIVNFSVEGGGILDTTRAVTDAKGIAVVNYFSGTKAAAAKVVATYGSSVKNIPISVISASSGKAIILISSSRAFLFANGIDSTQINIQVIPGEGIDIENQLLSLSSTFGSLPPNVVLDGKGMATAMLKSDTSDTDTQAMVTAGFGTLSAKTAVPVKAVSFDISSDQASLPADGRSTCKITAVVKQKSSGKPIGNAWLTFSSEAGAIQNEIKTEADGKATVTLTSTSTPDTSVIKAWYGDLADSLSIIFYSNNISDERSRIRSISAEKPEIWANPTFSDAITVEVVDPTGIVKPGATVYFQSSAGLLSHKQVVTDAQGKAVVYLSGYESDFDSTATVRADLYNGTPFAEVSVLLKSESYKPRFIEIKFDPPSIGVRETGQISTTNVIASVKDTKYRLVGDNIRVFFDVIEEPGGVQVTTITDQGVPTVKGVAKISCSAGTRSGTVRMRARLIDDPLTEEDESEIIVESTKLIIHAGPPFMADRNDPNTSHLSIAARRLNIWYGQDTTVVSVILGDKYRNPADNGTAVYLTASGGVVTTVSYTNKSGIANDTLFAGSPSPTVNRYHGYNLNLYDSNVAQFNGGVGPAPNFLGTLPPLAYGGDYTWNPNFDADNNKYNVIQYIPGHCYDFEGSEVPNTNTIDFTTPFTAWDKGENDGIARIRASTIGVDANNDSIYVWNWMSVIFSEYILTGGLTSTGVYLDGFRENSDEVIQQVDAARRNTYLSVIHEMRKSTTIPVSYTDMDLYNLVFPDGNGHIVFLGESISFMVRIYDRNGNPIHCGASVTANLTGDAPLGLSWTSYVNESGSGTTFYPIAISNEVNFEKPKSGGSPIRIQAHYRGGDPFIQTRSILAEANSAIDYISLKLSAIFF